MIARLACLAWLLVAASAPMIAAADGGQVSNAANTSPPSQSASSPSMTVVGDGAFLLPPRRGVSWDVQIEAGWGAALRNELPHQYFARLRAGMFVLREPQLFAFGPIVDIGGLIGLGAGGQLDFMHIASGISIELGCTVGGRDEAVTHASLGYALLALEWQHRFAERPADALMFKLRIPIGIGYYLYTHR